MLGDTAYPEEEEGRLPSNPTLSTSAAKPATPHHFLFLSPFSSSVLPWKLPSLPRQWSPPSHCTYHLPRTPGPASPLKMQQKADGVPCSGKPRSAEAGGGGPAFSRGDQPWLRLSCYLLSLLLMAQILRVIFLSSVLF